MSTAESIEETLVATASDAILAENVSDVATEPNVYEEKIYEGENYRITYTPYSVENQMLNAGICIENTGSDVLENWKLQFESTFSEINSWGMSPDATDDTGTIYSNLEYSQDIPVGESVMITLLATHTGEIYPSQIGVLTGERTLNPKDYQVEFQVMNSWNAGANCKLLITNNSEQVMEDWRLEFDYEGEISSFWTAILTAHEGNHYQMKNAGYNANIEPGQTIEVGFSTYFDAVAGMPASPTGYILNDLALVTGVPEDYILYELFPIYLKQHHYEGTMEDVDLHADYDGDGLTNEEEYFLGTLPGNPDSDGDGLSDYEEVHIYGTKPFVYDTDGDLLGDGCEILNGTDPLLADTNGNGIADGDEYVTDQKLTYQSYKWADFNWLKADVELSVSGYGDYSRQIRVETNPYEKTYSNLEYMITNVVYLSHNEDMEYDNAQITFRLSKSVLAENDLEDLYVVRLEDDGIVVCDTERNVEEGIVSARVDKLCKYVVLSKSKLIKISDFSESSAMLEDGKAEIVFVVDTTGSMRWALDKVKANIATVAKNIENAKVDVRFGLIEYKDIYRDGMNTTVSYGWSDTVEELVEKLNKLQIWGGGGDGPETALDGLDKALALSGYKGYTRYFVLITDDRCHMGIQGNNMYTMEDAIARLKAENVSVSVVGSPGYEIQYRNLVNQTGGIMCSLYQEFSVTLAPLVEKMKKDAHESNKKVVRLSNLALSTTALDWQTDSDHDGLPDLLEIGNLKSIDIFGYTIEYYANYSDPYDPDTDGDGLLDGEDPHVRQFDIIYNEAYEFAISYDNGKEHLINQFYMNTGKMTYQMFDSNYRVTKFAESVNLGKIFGDNLCNHLKEYLQAMDDTAFGKAYTLEELIYLGYTDPDLLKWMARDLDLEDWKRIYAGLKGCKYDERRGLIVEQDGTVGPSEQEVLWFFELPSKGDSIGQFLSQLVGHYIFGRYLNEDTGASMVVDIGLAFLGLDAYEDIRDAVYLFDRWENTSENYIEMGLLGVQVLPILGAFVKGSRAYMLIRSSSKTIRIAECATKTIDTIKNTKVIRYVDDLAFTAKHAVESLGAKTCNWIQTSLYNVKKTVKNLDARLNSCYMEAFDRLPENVKIFLKDNCGMIDLDASISRTVSQCQDASGTVLKSADEIAEVLEREIAYELTGNIDIIKIKTHIFSNDHIKNGIMNLGENEDAILYKLLNVVWSTKEMWGEGSNEIRAFINNYEVTIRFFVQKGKIINVDGFVGFSERVIGNLIELY